MRLAWFAGLALLGGGEQEKPFDAAQDRPGVGREIELRWNLPHDRAAVYDVYDPRTRKKRGEFRLLGCEAQSKLRIGANDTSDLAYRFLFRLPDRKVREGESWTVRETAFVDPDLKRDKLFGTAARWIVGSYRVRKIGRLRPKDVFRCAGDENAIDGVLLEGRFQVFRARRAAVAGRPTSSRSAIRSS